MSIKSLAVLVCLMVAGVLASANCYLSAERAPLARAQATAGECCESLCDENCGPQACFDTPPCAQSLRSAHRRMHRFAFAVRRVEGQTPRDS